jgi:hypothetical protein
VDFNRPGPFVSKILPAEFQENLSGDLDLEVTVMTPTEGFYLFCYEYVIENDYKRENIDCAIYI